MESIRELQAYGYAFASFVFAMILYGYIYHLYTSKKKGGKDYEKYSKMALNDSIEDSPVEKIEPSNEDKEER
ncbi:cytochrome c oxidase, cbb3-type, CcoQ subunit [Sulfurospirillum arcachonense]|uniref:cytochrome c oxidase, cbb3-type, CcoQ subunit n=1 Tax=Sulfurospirillum arcachonense TaxID=57666 RepID=UPI0004B331FF|nr:cytochrome c oxidase, cbb3-type, CcoQ subunit [Sulfurospirillum arcachonense]